MLIYAIVVMTPIILSPFLSIRKKVSINVTNKHHIIIDSKKLYAFLVLLILFLISTLRRYNIGADYHHYVDYFLVHHKWYSDSEFGLTILYKIAYFLWGENYVGMTVLINSLMFYMLFRYLVKYCTNRYIIVVLLVFLLNPYLYIQSTFNVIRQGIAMCFVLTAFSYLLDHDLKRFIICIGCGVIFHKLSLIFAFLPFIYKINWNKTKFFACGTVCFLANFLIYDLAMLRPIFSFFKFESYTTMENSMFNFRIFGIFVYLVLCFLLYFYDNLYRNKKEKAMIDLYLLSLAFLLLAVKNDGVYRVYIILACLTLPAIGIVLSNMHYTKFRLKKVLPYFYIVYYVFYYIVFLVSVAGNSNYIPFQFYFN